jgi:hypothetical protein
MTLEKNIVTKRLARRKITSEDFTPSFLVEQMLDKLLEYSPKTFTDITKTYIDPACGNGNMLVEVLKRKLQHATPIQAISTIYGTDIMKDNIIECRLRLIKVIMEHSKEQGYKNLLTTILDTKPTTLTRQDYLEIIKIVCRNIVCTPLKTYPNGSLDYLDLPESRTFNRHVKDEEANCIWDKIINRKCLDKIT